MRLQTIIASLVLTLSALVASTTAFAQSGGDKGYEFLNITTSSKVYAMGGQNITLIDDDINMINQNPALLGKEMHLQLGLNYMHYIGGSNFMGATFGLKAHERGALALGLQYFGYGEMKSAEADGTITGTFSPRDLSINLVYSHDITDRIRGGIAVKMISSSYEQYSAMALATDLGVNYFNPETDMSLSLVIKNLGGQVKKFNEETVDLPWDIQLGWSQFLRNSPFRLSVTATNLNKWKMPYYAIDDKAETGEDIVEKEAFMSSLFRHLTFGVEYAPSSKFYIGLGYSYKTRTDMTTYSRNFLSGFSLGAGFNTNALGFGVALAQPHVGGTTFMFNLRCNIAQFLNRKHCY